MQHIYFNHAPIATVTVEQMEDGNQEGKGRRVERVRDEHRRVTSKVPTCTHASSIETLDEELQRVNL